MSSNGGPGPMRPRRSTDRRRCPRRSTTQPGRPRQRSSAARRTRRSSGACIFWYRATTVAVAQQGGGVVDARGRAVHEPDEDRAPAGGRAREVVERVARLSSDECGAEHQVLGRVAGDRELREADQRPRRPRSPGRPRRPCAATFPSRSPTVVFSWPSAIRTTRKPSGRWRAIRARRCRRCRPPRRGPRRAGGGGSPSR